jgi:Cys-rich repeat protein
VSRLATPLLLAVLGLFSACDKDGDQKNTRRYCDTTGCFECVSDRCYPVPGEPAKPDQPTGGTVTTCDNDAACGDAKVCNLGRCEPACRDNSACASGSACISGRCRPAGAEQCGVGGALCSSDAQCGTGRVCVAKACATACPDSKCPVGQVCSAGACVEDPSPASPQCTFDLDCGGGFRCINAYCLPTCTDSKQCSGGASCVKGTCRGSRLPAG